MNNNNSWEHPFQKGNKTEPVQSFEAFQLWVEMGDKRSLKAVAERMEKSHDTIKKYSCTWKWSERLQDKLTYENKIIHGKQLENVITSLDNDARRDIILQFFLGNIMGIMFEVGMDNMNSFSLNKRNIKTGKLEENPKLLVLERLSKLYCQLEGIHTQTQNKLIDFNNKCLTYQTFNDVDEYEKLLKNGKDQFNDIMYNVVLKTEKSMEHTNTFGICLNMGDLYKSYKDNNKNDGSEKLEEMEEPDKLPEGNKKKKRKQQKKTT